MLLWNKEEVSRGHWMDIFESNYFLILIENGGREFFPDDFAKEAVCVHRSSILRTTTASKDPSMYIEVTILLLFPGLVPQ